MKTIDAKVDSRVEFNAGETSRSPAHIETFETYYYLGENRSLKQAAFIRFRAQVPNCPPDDPQFERKFGSFYKKVKRWAAKENWQELVMRREIEESLERKNEMAILNGHLWEALRGYQSFVRQSLAIFAEKAKLPFLLKQAIAKGNAEAEAEIRQKIGRGEGVEIKNFREAKEMVELDIYLSERLAQQPEPETESDKKLSEEEAQKVDKIMEFFRRHSQDKNILENLL